MRLKMIVENVETEEREEVIANLAVLRRWEQDNGKPALRAIDDGYVGPLLELAALAHNRKHGGTLDVEEFIDSFDVVEFKAAGGPATGNPSDPATAPPSA